MCLLALLALARPAPARAAGQPQAAGFDDWNLPLPAGTWLISRGPCGSAGTFTHQCGYYEDHCALDLTPANGASMQSVPVLAPQDGQVFFLGTRADSGLTVMLQHGDGRVSALMHLSRVVVGLDERVVRGQVIAYAGNSGSSTKPHVHFHVQPNAVERECLPLAGLDEVDLVNMTAVSHNLAWPELSLAYPPPDVPGWLAPAGPAAAADVVVPGGLTVAPSARVTVPVAVRSALLAGFRLLSLGRLLTPAATAGDYTVFNVSFSAPARPGDGERWLDLRARAGQPGPNQIVRVNYSVRQPADTSASRSVVLISPSFVGPANWSELRQPPELCWSEPLSAGAAPLLFRAMVVGPASADSGWMPATCWQAPALPTGTYQWKVFVRDASGLMNRTNQRPFVFRLVNLAAPRSLQNSPDAP